ncbi:Hypothetical protein D9617_22g067080 [Elsinoe fawcettii]|nr:Hypothetical protein D9617_22g067080 [Elsinoe fawcettii]
MPFSTFDARPIAALSDTHLHDGDAPAWANSSWLRPPAPKNVGSAETTTPKFDLAQFFAMVATRKARAPMGRTTRQGYDHSHQGSKPVMDAMVLTWAFSKAMKPHETNLA